MAEGTVNRIWAVSAEKIDFIDLCSDYDYSYPIVPDQIFSKPVANVSKKSKPLSIVDNEWELIDPHPDVHGLFMEFDSRFFYGKLQAVEVKWSPRMTSCAGVCSYQGRGGLCSIRLSAPLLKYRPRRDLVETLLHEMIHAYLFVTGNNRDREDHGPNFLSHMNRINKETGTKITVYHSFHDEVNLYKQHWWKCEGPCKNRSPFYGLVKRAMNRAPGPNDNWWASHQATCGGKFVKIKEPDNYKAAAKKKSSDSGSKNSSDIRGFLKDKSEPNKPVYSSSSTTKTSNITSLLPVQDSSSSGSDTKSPVLKNFVPFQGSGYKLGGTVESHIKSPSLLSEYSKKPSANSSTHTLERKIPKSIVSRDIKVQGSTAQNNSAHKRTSSFTQSAIDNFLTPKLGEKAPSLFQRSAGESAKVACPVCFLLVEENKINYHLDACITK